MNGFYLTDDDICSSINVEEYFSKINSLDLGMMNKTKLSDIPSSIKQQFNKELLQAHESGISLVKLVDIIISHYVDAKIVREILNEDVKVVLAIEIDYEYYECSGDFLDGYF